MSLQGMNSRNSQTAGLEQLPKALLPMPGSTIIWAVQLILQLRLTPLKTRIVWSLSSAVLHITWVAILM